MLDDFRRIAQEASRAVRAAEPGLAVYAWLVGQDKTTVRVDLWFTGPEAALQHLQGIAPQKFLPQALAIAELAGFEVHGTPTSALEKALAGFPVSGRNGEIAGYVLPPKA